MRYFYMIIVLMVSSSLFAQSNYSVDTLYFPFRDNHVPVLKDLKDTNNSAVQKINSSLMEDFDSVSLYQDTVGMGNSYMEFNYKINKNIFYLDYYAEWCSAYITPYKRKLYFDLLTGKELNYKEISFESLFKPEAYFSFINEYWKPIADSEFAEAITFAEGTLPSCSRYSIAYQTYGDSVTLSFDGIELECYPHVIKCCSPSFNIKLPLSTLLPYLNQYGVDMLTKDHYFEKNPIDQFLYNEEIYPKLTNRIYIRGKINDKYPFFMEIETDSKNKVSGYYAYENQQKRIQLSGEHKDGKSIITESVDGETTGSFSFTWKDHDYDIRVFRSWSFDYIKGEWSNLKGTVTYPITITEVRGSKHLLH